MVFNIDNNKKCFLGTKSVLEESLKDHVTLNDAKNSALPSETNYILK